MMENIFTQSNETQVHSMAKPSKAKQLEEWRSILSNEVGDEGKSKRWGML